MEFAELTKLVVGRIQKLEPDNIGKIMGCILLQEPEENDMLQLAYDNDSVLLSKINDAKAMLAAIYARFSVQPGPGVHSGLHLHPISGIRHFSPATALSFHVQSQYWSDTQQAADKHTEFTQSHNVFVDSPAVEHHHYSLRSQPKQVFGLDDMAASYCYSEDAFAAPPRALGRRSSGLSRRPCYYFIKGICKNGENCNYSHHHVYSDVFDGEHGTTPGSLEKLELEITEILKSRRGQPVSIASLPTLYGEKYGRGLQADGYLTESQRHGKAGYSLTKLLSRLNKIRVVERPHGQHSVVLAEDAATYTDFRCDKGDQGVIPASSHQIYLTFPAESTFTEDDVASYFGRFGPVRDVRIPCQERRMFGFVSFQSPETVTTIFMEGNPHSICGSRVLVKPYREKSKCLGRTYTDKIKPANCYPPRYFDFDPELCAGEYDHATRFMRKQLAEKHERMMEFERRRLPRLSELRLDAMPQYAYFNYSFEDFNSTQPDCKELDSADPFIFPPDSLQNVNVSTSQVPTRQANNYDDQESDQIELLPESPFSSAADGNSISRII